MAEQGVPPPLVSLVPGASDDDDDDDGDGESAVDPDRRRRPRRRRLPAGVVSAAAPDRVFLCRKVYDFRQKRILKNPT